MHLQILLVLGGHALRHRAALDLLARNGQLVRVLAQLRLAQQLVLLQRLQLTVVLGGLLALDLLLPFGTFRLTIDGGLRCRDAGLAVFGDVLLAILERLLQFGFGALVLVLHQIVVVPRCSATKDCD